MFNDNQQYAADDGDGEEREQTAVVEDGQTEALLVDALVKTFLLVKVDVDQILQVPRLVVVLDLLGNWFLNIKKILLLHHYANVDTSDFLPVGSLASVDVQLRSALFISLTSYLERRIFRKAYSIFILAKRLWDDIQITVWIQFHTCIIQNWIISKVGVDVTISKTKKIGNWFGHPTNWHI